MFMVLLSLIVSVSTSRYCIKMVINNTNRLHSHLQKQHCVWVQTGDQSISLNSVTDLANSTGITDDEAGSSSQGSHDDTNKNQKAGGGGSVEVLFSERPASVSPQQVTEDDCDEEADDDDSNGENDVAAIVAERVIESEGIRSPTTPTNQTKAASTSSRPAVGLLPTPSLSSTIASPSPQRTTRMSATRFGMLCY